jgi:hypothetical protein
MYQNVSPTTPPAAINTSPAMASLRPERETSSWGPPARSSGVPMDKSNFHVLFLTTFY